MLQEKRTLGSIIKEKRLSKGLSLRQLAKRIGKSPSWVSKVELGLDENCKEETLAKIGQELELLPDGLLCLTGRLPSRYESLLKTYPIEVIAALNRVLLITSGDNT